jgi:serine/threonine protein kinase
MVGDDMLSVPGEFTEGSELAGYRLDEQVGRGSRAVVYRAYDTRLGRRVAVKILAPS